VRVDVALLRAPLVVMFSGGRDSTALLHVAREVVPSVTALHVDHGLRPDSGADASHCASVCSSLGVDLVTERVGPPGAGVGNLQAWARDARYAAALALGGDIAVGHTASDQVETILYRLAASPGRRALLGMSPREGRIVRPLLSATRADTLAYCEDHGLPFLDDPANEDPSYARARVRGAVVPAFRSLHPAAEENVLRTASLLREEAEALDAVVDDLLGEGEAVPLDRLRAAHPALARLAVRRLAERTLDARAPRVLGRADEVLSLGPDAALDLGDGARARVRGGVLSFERSPARGA
jgi:tRNA(Ile)-lysidine synthase